MKSLENILKTEINKQDGLQLVELIDLTSLNLFDNREDILRLIDKANNGIKGNLPAAICVYHCDIDFIRPILNPNIKLVVVGCNFPHGHQDIKLQLLEAAQIKSSSIDELDIVMNLGDLKSKKYAKIISEINSVKNALGNIKLKVILETGDLNLDEVKIAAELAISGGADFIKTSTGKTKNGAKYEAVYLMCQVINLHFMKTGIRIGIKPSGGIRTIKDALYFYEIVQEVLGEAWLNNRLFRFGASGLFDNLYKKFN